MVKKSKTAGADIDWYLISIERLKQIGLVILLLVIGLAGWWFFSSQKRNPRQTAEGAIAEARQALNELAASKEFATHRTEFDRASKRLDAAGDLLKQAKYVDAQGAAVESQTISRAALSGSTGAENDAQFLTVEGEVQYQKASTSDWHRAEVRTGLYSGDWVKTSQNATAELIFSNGSLYTVGSNALLEIYAQFNPATSKKSNSVQMQVGTVEVATTDDTSTVRTPGSQIVVDSESTTHVGVDSSSKATSVMATKGSASITSPAGGAAVKIASGEKVTATSEGALSAVKKLSLPPALLTPADNQVFPADSKIDFVWGEVPGNNGYVFQVSRSRLFTVHEINSKRQKTTATAKVTSEGSFYWRVASVGPDGDTGPFSGPFRFRVSGGNQQPGSTAQEGPAPTLTLKRPYPLGGVFFMIEGATDPGATVFINDEEVDVESNGHFKKLVSFSKVGRNSVVVKAVNAAGKQTVQSETVLVEE